MKFTYSSGQRPLEGYTIKRGVGHGGFGEVYFAVSDGGKEVALKLVRGEEDVELRGVAQCLNLKHPNLVSLYDLRLDPQGNHWVVMEYINGETLSVVLGRHPEGLAPELAVQWFIAMARAIGHLHEHGIVHRDLKPGNIFLENGLVKVGDYGLSKFISGSSHMAQTQSVGTVHYMAPEVSTGNYTKQIDIYAAGIILYEMLTGHVPFEGESTAEILMKHLTTPPDLSKVPAPYRPIIGQALAKNPAQRYGSMAEMIRAVESVGQAQSRRPEPVHQAIPVPPPRRPAAHVEPILNALPAPSFRQQVVELCGSLALTTLFAVVSTAVATVLTEPSRFGAIFLLTVAVCWAVLIPAKFWITRRGDGWKRRAVMLVIGVLVGLGALWLDGWNLRLPMNEPVLGADETWTFERQNQRPHSRRESVVITEPSQRAHSEEKKAVNPERPIAVPPIPVAQPRHSEEKKVVSSERPVLPLPTGPFLVAGYLAYFGLAFFILRWWRLVDRHRRRWFAFFPVLATVLWAFVLLALAYHDYMVSGLTALIASSIILQLAAPWEPPAPRPAKPLRLRYAS